MKTAGRENPNRRAIVAGAEHMARKVRTDPAQSSGLRSRKSFSQWGWCFFLDFFPYRTFHVLTTFDKIFVDYIRVPVLCKRHKFLFLFPGWAHFCLARSFSIEGFLEVVVLSILKGGLYEFSVEHAPSQKS